VTKEQIFNLIDSNIDAAFDELDYVSKKAQIYQDLNKEYISPPLNFSLPHFRSRLKRFANGAGFATGFRPSKAF
jgi:hypothetical protein